MMTNVVECEFDALEVGMALEVVFEQVSDDPQVTSPVVPPVQGASASGSDVSNATGASDRVERVQLPVRGPAPRGVPGAARGAERLAEPDRLAARARPQDPRAHPARVHGDPAQPCRASRRHARLAREVGATWDEVLGSIMLTCPAFGMLARGRGDPARARRLRRRAPKWTKTTTMSDAGPFRDPAARSPIATGPSGPAGRDGELRFLRCQDCRYCDPPATSVLCPMCHSKDIESRRCRDGRRCTPSP